MPTCRVDVCVKEAKAAFGLCHMHYKRLKRYGHPTAPAPVTPPGERILERVIVQPGEDGCWLYDSIVHRSPRIQIKGVRYEARWVLYEWLVGHLNPDGKLHNTCGHVRCVRPDHHEYLSPVAVARARKERARRRESYRFKRAVGRSQAA